MEIKKALKSISTYLIGAIISGSVVLGVRWWFESDSFTLLEFDADKKEKFYDDLLDRNKEDSELLKQLEDHEIGVVQYTKCVADGFSSYLGNNEASVTRGDIVTESNRIKSKCLAQLSNRKTAMRRDSNKENMSPVFRENTSEVVRKSDFLSDLGNQLLMDSSLHLQRKSSKDLSYIDVIPKVPRSIFGEDYDVRADYMILEQLSIEEAQAIICFANQKMNSMKVETNTFCDYLISASSSIVHLVDLNGDNVIEMLTVDNYDDKVVISNIDYSGKKTYELSALSMLNPYVFGGELYKVGSYYVWYNPGYRADPITCAIYSPRILDGRTLTGVYECDVVDLILNSLTEKFGVERPNYFVQKGIERCQFGN